MEHFEYISFQLFLESFPTDFLPLWIVNTSPLQRCFGGMMAVFFLPSNAKFSSSFVGAFVSFKEFIFFFSPHAIFTRLLFFEREERRTFSYFHNESN